RNPVAAHAFLDHLLRFDVALDNFAWNGYQVPMQGATREAFADPSFRWHNAVPANLRDAIVSEAEFAQGQMLVGFGPAQEAAWLARRSGPVPAGPSAARGVGGPPGAGTQGVGVSNAVTPPSRSPVVAFTPWTYRFCLVQPLPVRPGETRSPFAVA